MTRRISNQELCDLPQNWENPTVDPRHCWQSATAAWEVSERLYLKCRAEGFMCQQHDGRFYVGECEGVLDLVT